MSFAHVIQPGHRDPLIALSHPDGTTRTQTLRQEDDPWLYELLLEMGKITGYPILVNTSFNGRGEPIVETPLEAVELFLKSDGIDFLLLESFLLSRSNSWQSADWPIHLRIAEGAILSYVFPGKSMRAIVTRANASEEVSHETSLILQECVDGVDLSELISRLKRDDGAVLHELYLLVTRGFLNLSPLGDRCLR
jgi:carbamoyltransferase